MGKESYILSFIIDRINVIEIFQYFSHVFDVKSCKLASFMIVILSLSLSKQFPSVDGKDLKSICFTSNKNHIKMQIFQEKMFYYLSQQFSRG